MGEGIYQAVDEYIEGLFVPADPVLESTKRSIIDAGMPEISVSPNQGRLLQLLATLRGARTVLEIGTLGGYSTTFLARALPEDGRVISLELDEKHAEVARKNIARAGMGSKVTIRVGKALDTLPRLVEESAGPFDVIFIDADKQPYSEYLSWALRLSQPGTLIIADNVIRDGRVLESKDGAAEVDGVRTFNEKLAAADREGRVIATILQTVGVKGHDGMAIAVVR